MAGTHAAEMADDRPAGEIQIAIRIEQLVADEFVGEAQAAGVQHPVAADHDGVVERAAAGQSGGLEPRQVVEQAEGACRRELGLEALRLDAQCQVLRRISALSNSISKLIEKPCSGSSAAEAPLSPTVTGFRILMARRAASCARCRHARSARQTAPRCRP